VTALRHPGKLRVLIHALGEPLDPVVRSFDHEDSEGLTAVSCPNLEEPVAPSKLDREVENLHA
jgi:hypothetical protein